MTLERTIGLLFLLFCCIYGYTAYAGMDHLLPPILQRAHPSGRALFRKS